MGEIAIWAYVPRHHMWGWERLVAAVLRWRRIYRTDTLERAWLRR